MHLIEISLDIALKAYTGKTDKAGAPYVLHPLRLMAKMKTDRARAAALLHDVIEDADLTADDLLAAGIPKDVVDAVVALSRRDGETYDAFIERVARDRLAVEVKRADIADNLDVLRLTTLTDKDLARISRYHRAWQRLTTCRLIA